MLNQKWERQKIRTDAMTALLCTGFETVAVCMLWCHRFVTWLAHRGTLCTYHKCYEAELIWCRTLVLAAPRKAGVVIRGVGDAAAASAAASSGPPISQLQCEAKGVMGRGRKKRKE